MSKSSSSSAAALEKALSKADKKGASSTHAKKVPGKPGKRTVKRATKSFFIATAKKLARVRGLGWANAKFTQGITYLIVSANVKGYIKKLHQSSAAGKTITAAHAAQSAKEMETRDPGVSIFSNWKMMVDNEKERQQKHSKQERKKEKEGKSSSSSSSSSSKAVPMTN
jgi:hypothetical protein